MTTKRIYQGVKRRIANFLATNSSYHFLVRDWQQINDVDLAVKVLGTDFFRGQVKPIELPIYSGQRIMVIAPHQDDEVIGAGGTLVKASKLGAKIHILFATDGSQNNIGCSLEESVKVRNIEARKVCDYIGAKFDVLPISNFNPKLHKKHLEELHAHIQRFKPDVLLVPWLLDAPVKHRLINHLLSIANSINPLPKMEVWGYQVHNTLYPNAYVDITSTIEDKKHLISLYKSQNENIQCYDHLSVGMSAWNSRFMPVSKTNGIVTRKYGEVFFTLPSQDYLRLIDRYYNQDLNQVYKGNTIIVNELSNLLASIKNDIS